MSRYALLTGCNSFHQPHTGGGTAQCVPTTLPAPSHPRVACQRGLGQGVGEGCCLLLTNMLACPSILSNPFEHTYHQLIGIVLYKFQCQ